MSRFQRTRGWLAFGVLAGAAACGSDVERRGGLMLMVSQDGTLEIDRLEIKIAANGKTIAENTYRVPQEAELPTTLALVSNGKPSGSAEITVVGWHGDAPLDRRDAIVTQVPTDRVAGLRIVLSGSCSPHVTLRERDDETGPAAESTCEGGQTCDPGTGNCIDANVDASLLADYHQGDEANPSDGGAPSDPVAGAGGTAGGSTASGGGGTVSSSGTSGDGAGLGGALGGTDAGSGGDGGDAGDGGQGGAAAGCTPACTAAAPVCLNQACVACSPSPTPTTCRENTPQYCDDSGNWHDMAAGECPTNETCAAGECECALTKCSSACVDIKTDAANCGACGHACSVGTCSAGTCQPVTLATAQTKLGGLGVGGGKLYWVTNGKIWVATLTTQQSAQLALTSSDCNQGIGGPLVANTSNVYWISMFVCYRLHANQGSDGRAPGAMYGTGESRIGDLAVGGGNAYSLNKYDRWLQSSDGSHYIYAFSGGGGSVSALAADANNVYWFQGTGPGAYFIYKHAGPHLDDIPIEVVHGQDASEAMAAHDGFLYWTSSTGASSATGTIKRVSINGGAVQTIATGQTNPTGIAVDASGVYWTNHNATGSVMRVAHAGGTVVPLATNQNGAHAIVLDSSTIYWTNVEGSQVMMVSK